MSNKNSELQHLHAKTRQRRSTGPVLWTFQSRIFNLVPGRCLSPSKEEKEENEEEEEKDDEDEDEDEEDEDEDEEEEEEEELMPDTPASWRVHCTSSIPGYKEPFYPLMEQHRFFYDREE
uniref:Uncharacterized protein n=1 Tax=Vespula pensylvanica TaxID=30213 RepID=A0A834N4T3_VESPE|nr:hypothetical protein H0235_016948 [Vespula pensylvanica]